MIRAFTGVGVVALFSGAVFGQAGITASETSAPAFVAADVHVSAKSRTPSMAAGGLRGTRYLVRQATMVDLINLAYDVDNDKILGGPSWLETDRFDVSARDPAGSTPEEAKGCFRRCSQSGSILSSTRIRRSCRGSFSPWEAASPR